MEKQISCGVIITDLEVLLGCHPSNGIKNIYDIPKGLKEENETHLECILRECKEETGIQLQENNLKNLGLFEYKKDKDLYLFSYVLGNLPSTKTLKSLDGEMDYYFYVPINELDKYFFKNLLRVLKEAINKIKE
jgi:8-oxo-dGTP pyrophosphatase MutT (NUDIX family)